MINRDLDALFESKVLGLENDSGVPLDWYTQSLDAAWEGVEKLADKLEGCFHLSLWNDDEGEQYYEAELVGVSVDAATPARAVVLACLKAVAQGVW